ncbi:MAG: 50S ribosomal protein L18 [Puniceicoccales bacterium]|jgi:large subunit ribosomal protein L18|nr:50S ribosomal protein L18 [Puniceicoccales bacterium]
MDPVRKNILARKRRWRVRARVSGTGVRPRLCVRFSNRHIYAQCIDDCRAITLVSASSLMTVAEPEKGVRANVVGAKILGGVLAVRAQEAGIKRVIFDRGARKYHGCVEAFADAARGCGLEF